MVRPGGQLRQAQAAEPLSHRAGMHLRHAEVGSRLLDKVDPPPSHDAIFIEVWALLHDLIEFIVLLRCQQATPARRRECRQCADTALIVALDPIAQRLAIHVGELSRPASRPSVQHERNRLQPAGVARLLQAGGHSPQVPRRVLLACYLDWCRHCPAPRIGFAMQEQDHGCAVLRIVPTSLSLRGVVLRRLDAATR